MKRILLVLLMAFGFTTLVSAKGEGPVLGKAWKDCNEACALIATKDDSNTWIWNKDMMDKNGAKAEKALAKVQAEADDAATDDIAIVCKGKNSLKNLNKLIKHALKAIHDNDNASKEDTESDDDSSAK